MKEMMTMLCSQLGMTKCGKLRMVSPKTSGSQVVSMKLWVTSSMMRTTRMKKRVSRTKMRMMTRTLTKTMMMKKVITTFENGVVVHIAKTDIKFTTNVVLI